MASLNSILLPCFLPLLPTFKRTQEEKHTKTRTGDLKWKKKILTPLVKKDKRDFLKFKVQFSRMHLKFSQLDLII